jgi:hypothetical protein
VRDFENIGQTGFWWSADLQFSGEYGINDGMEYWLNYYDAFFSWGSNTQLGDGRYVGESVRCVKDQ